MKKILNSLICILAMHVIMIGCKEDDYELGTPPAEDEAAFTYTPSETSNNIINLSNTSTAFLKKWDLGTGEVLEGDNVQAVYPFKGTYEVTLTIYTAGGSTSSKQSIVIEETDLTLLKPVYKFLTGGDAGKTWVIASSVSGHMGIGPADNDAPIWWAAPANDKSGTGLYDDKYTFKLEGFTFTHDTNGDVYVNGAQKDKFPGAYVNKGDYTAPFTAPANLTWSISTNAKGRDVITITNNGFIGYYAGTSKFEIISINDNEMFIKFIDAAAPGNAWFHKLVAEGFTPPPPPPPAKTSLPQDFEGATPPFNGFGGSTFEVVDNPNKAGINTSNKVGKYVKGFDGNWAGIETTLTSKLDFSTNTTLRYNVYSSVAGKALFKIEATDGSASPVEVFVNTTKVNEWETISFDFSAAQSNVYDKIALFLDFDNNAGGTFYIDDIKQSAPGCSDEENESLDVSTGLNMTMATTGFGQFGNIVSEIVANPFKTGINTSCFVNSYGKTNGCETWSGVGYLLNTAIDFSNATKKKFKLKVYAVNEATTVTLRLERLPFPDTEPSAERTATITATGQWQEVEFDFSDINANTYKNVLIYFEKGTNCDGDLYYFDDLRQVN